MSDSLRNFHFVGDFTLQHPFEPVLYHELLQLELFPYLYAYLLYPPTKPPLSIFSLPEYFFSTHRIGPFPTASLEAGIALPAALAQGHE